MPSPKVWKHTFIFHPCKFQKNSIQKIGKNSHKYRADKMNSYLLKEEFGHFQVILIFRTPLWFRGQES